MIYCILQFYSLKMEKMQKDWQQKGTASVYLKREDLTTIAIKLEKMISLPRVSHFLAEEAPIQGGTALKFLMPVETMSDRQEKISIVRDLLTLAAFRPEITRITALHEGKKLPKNHVDFSLFKMLLRSKGVDWNRNI